MKMIEDEMSPSLRKSYKNIMYSGFQKQVSRDNQSKNI